MKDGLGTTDYYSFTEINSCLIVENYVEVFFLIECVERSKTIIQKVIFRNNFMERKGIFKIIKLAYLTLDNNIFKENIGNEGSIIFSVNSFFGFILKVKIILSILNNIFSRIVFFIKIQQSQILFLLGIQNPFLIITLLYLMKENYLN